MYNDLSDILNKHTALLNQLVVLLSDLTKKNTFEQDWYDSNDAMRVLKVCERSLYRLRKGHPEQCRKVMGKWYYNITVLLVFKGKN